MTVDEIKARSKELTKAMAALVAERHRIWQRHRAGKATSEDIARSEAAETERRVLKSKRNVLSQRLHYIRAVEKNEKQRAQKLDPATRDPAPST